jgi:heparan sulfate 6-O-sulfotransferase HS6ST1
VDLSIRAFIYCRCNLAANRQTRMLASYDSEFNVCEYLKLALVDDDSFDDILLERAIRGLHQLSFFGLAEHQHLSRVLFRKTFGNFFKLGNEKRASLIDRDDGKGERSLKETDRRLVEKIQSLNRLDIRLYEYASKLFFQRLKYYNISIPVNLK